MKCEIDIDLGPLADEWEPVAFRRVLKGDWFVPNTDDKPILSTVDCLAGGPRIIVRRRWKWPEWLTAEWIAMDELGGWFGYTSEPLIPGTNSGVWSSDGELCNLNLTAFIPPPCTDWTQSKRRNPNAKATP